MPQIPNEAPVSEIDEEIIQSFQKSLSAVDDHTPDVKSRQRHPSQLAKNRGKAKQLRFSNAGSLSTETIAELISIEKVMQIDRSDEPWVDADSPRTGDR